MADPSPGFSAFYDATWDRTVACAYGITGDLAAAEDLAQDAYTRAWQRWSKISGYDKPAAWVQRVATRLAISRWRRDRVADAFVARHRLTESTPGPNENSVALA
ncbi:MAG: sigma factor [Microlunatus sp.]